MDNEKEEWAVMADAFDANEAILQAKINWLKLGRAFSAAVDSASSDWGCEGPQQADEAMAFAARAEACLFRATGDCEAVDADLFVSELARKEDSHAG